MSNQAERIKKVEKWIKQHDCKHKNVTFHERFAGLWMWNKACDDCEKTLQTYLNKNDYMVDLVKHELDKIKRKIKDELVFGDAWYAECKEAIKKLYKEL